VYNSILGGGRKEKEKENSSLFSSFLFLIPKRENHRCSLLNLTLQKKKKTAYIFLDKLTKPRNRVLSKLEESQQ